MREPGHESHDHDAHEGHDHDAVGTATLTTYEGPAGAV